MMPRVLAVALIAAVALALEAAFLQSLVVTPLASALARLRPAPAPQFEETMTIIAAPAPSVRPVPAS